MKVKITWYDMESQKAVDIIDNASSEEDAINKGFLKYNGTPPANLYNTEILER